MAQVDASLPRATEISVVDAKQLWGEQDPPEINPETGMPLKLKAFVVCNDPKVTVVPHCLSDVECDHILGLVEGNWMPSTVGVTDVNRHKLQEQDKSLQNKQSSNRTSWSCQMRYAQTEVVERLEHRLARVADVPVSTLERLNLVRYAPGELFNEHHDGKFRPRTVFVYLNDMHEDDEGGDTFFPILGLSFRPRRGTAVVWPNALPSGKEDSRMLHAGRPPARGTKYGVNCFFNDQDFRSIVKGDRTIPVEESTLVRIGDLADSPEQASCAFVCLKDPKVIAKPGLLSAEEAEHLLQVAAESAGSQWARSEGPFCRGTQTATVLEAEQTPIIERVEHKIASLCGHPLEHLARLRVVRTPTRSDLCNRGSGHTTVHICLQEQDEVWFPALGVRFAMRKGDALYWANTRYCEGQLCDDVRTQRVHTGNPGDDGELQSTLGLDAFFLDNAVREQQRQRQFVAESATE